MRKQKCVWFLMLGFLIALTGCGSDGNGKPAMMGGGMNGGGTSTPDPMSIDLTGLAAGMMLGDAMEYTIQPGGSQDSGDVAFSCPAGGEACMVTVAADGTATYDGNGGTPTVANTQVALDRMNAAAAAAARALAGKIAQAIARPDKDNNDAFDGTIDRTSPNDLAANGNRSLKVDASKVTHIDMKKFTMSSDIPAALTGFAGSIHKRANRDAATATMPRVTDEVTVYTNQEAPKPAPFSGTGGVHTLNAGGTAESRTALNIVDDLTTSFTAGKNGTMLSTLVNITQHRPSAGSNEITFGKADANTIKSLTGMFDMAPGMYECATTCMLTINNEGVVSAITSDNNDLTFVPASGAMVPVPDQDYLTFGYWVSTSTPMTGGATTTIAPFATGKVLYGITQIDAYDGAITDDSGIQNNTSISATYTGRATGQFVHKMDVDRDGKGLVPTSSGQFTAEANLTANFTKGLDSNLGTAFHNAIHGTVSNFKNSSTGQNIEGWTLTLNPAKFDGGNTDETARGGFTFYAGTSGGKDTAAGGWRGNFYGPATDGTDDDAIQPGSVAGEFLGHFSNGHAVGAFGATKDK